MRKWIVSMLVLLLCLIPATSIAAKNSIAINVSLDTPVTDSIIADLSKYGKVLTILDNINCLTMKVDSNDLANIQSLTYVSAANPDAVRNSTPINTVTATDFNDGYNTWDLDAVNVTDYGTNQRTVAYDGAGVYVAVLDTGLVDNWREYFPEERIAEEYAISFGGGGGENGTVSSQPNKWEHDQNSHGTHVTSSILGFSLRGTPINGTAPSATVIPVKVLNQNGSGWSSVVAMGISYVADLKSGPLQDYPVIINMSLGGGALDAVEKAAIDKAIEAGVIIVASAGNEGAAGMGYPGAYEPVISVAASGWTGEWTSSSWRYSDVPDPTSANDFYITDFSSRELTGQDLDVAAPGSWIVGPYQNNSGPTSYYYLGGTSMASPHVAGIAALMAQKCPALTASMAESILENTAIDLPAGSRTIIDPNIGSYVTVTWESNATGSGLVDAVAALAALN